MLGGLPGRRNSVMKYLLPVLVFALCVAGPLRPVAAESTPFTFLGYHFELGLPSSGTNDMEFVLCPDRSIGSQLRANPTSPGIAVAEGHLTVGATLGAV
jgi:hypothetical protein